MAWGYLVLVCEPSSFLISPCRTQQRSRCLYVQVFNFIFSRPSSSLPSRASFFFSPSLFLSLRHPSFFTACSFIPWLTVYSLKHTQFSHSFSHLHYKRGKHINQLHTHTYPSHFLSSLSPSNLSDPSHGGLHSQCSGLQGSLRQALRQAQRCRPRGREVSD